MTNMPLFKCLLAVLSVLSHVGAVAASMTPTSMEFEALQAKVGDHDEEIATMKAQLEAVLRFVGMEPPSTPPSAPPSTPPSPPRISCLLYVSPQEG